MFFIIISSFTERLARKSHDIWKNRHGYLLNNYSILYRKKNSQIVNESFLYYRLPLALKVSLDIKGTW